MATILTIPDEGRAEKATSASLLYEFDYDDNLASGVGFASIGTFTIDPADDRLTKDSESVASGSRQVRVRLSGGKPGKTYTVKHSAETDENPSQTKTKWFHLFIKAEA